MTLDFHSYLTYMILNIFPTLQNLLQQKGTVNNHTNILLHYGTIVFIFASNSNIIITNWFVQKKITSFNFLAFLQQEYGTIQKKNKIETYWNMLFQYENSPISSFQGFSFMIDEYAKIMQHGGINTYYWYLVRYACINQHQSFCSKKNSSYSLFSTI